MIRGAFEKFFFQQPPSFTPIFGLERFFDPIGSIGRCHFHFRFLRFLRLISFSRSTFLACSRFLRAELLSCLFLVLGLAPRLCSLSPISTGRTPLRCSFSPE